MYIWEHSDWPLFTCNEPSINKLLAEVSQDQGRLLGKMESLGFELRDESHLLTLIEDVVKTSEIEGELLERNQVRSSLAQQLGIDIAETVQVDRNVEGVVEMMLDATGNYSETLTKERLLAWHAALFPTGRSGMSNIRVGQWRDDSNGPMQVISGPIGKQKVHYEAPPAAQVDAEMTKFLEWFKHPGDVAPLLIAGQAHLWFLTIHPFEDGNGRIARAIADMALARSEKTPQRFYSMSAQILIERKSYYEKLEKTQKGELDISNWLSWFLNCLKNGIHGAQDTIAAVLDKAHFWERFAKEPLNQRQIKVLNKLLDGFEGNLTTSKWAKLAKCSQDTAYRDILDLLSRGALQKNSGGGRSTSYLLVTEYD